jgi:Uma2 family endonuclease
MDFKIKEAKPEAASKEKYTYGDYLTWSHEERWELIDGVPYNMTPAPSRRHQEVLGALYVQFFLFLEGKPCKVYLAPFDVRIPEEDKEDQLIQTVVQPDLVIVCDQTKLDEKGCKGVPDLVVEVLSPHTAGKDLKLKMDLYERVGVKEYWVVHPIDQTLLVFKYKEGKYIKPESYIKGDKILASILVDELSIDLAKVFME